jgi:hypothetical protein
MTNESAATSGTQSTNFAQLTDDQLVAAIEAARPHVPAVEALLARFKSNREMLDLCIDVLGEEEVYGELIEAAAG